MCGTREAKSDISPLFWGQVQRRTRAVQKAYRLPSGENALCLCSGGRILSCTVAGGPQSHSSRDVMILSDSRGGLMKNTVIGGLLVTTLWIAPAIAADMAIRAPARAVVSEAIPQNWSGFYAGIH